jgi:hypothetical protein
MEKKRLKKGSHSQWCARTTTIAMSTVLPIRNLALLVAVVAGVTSQALLTLRPIVNFSALMRAFNFGPSTMKGRIHLEIVTSLERLKVMQMLHQPNTLFGSVDECSPIVEYS